jgi:hypothetical protein
MMSDTMNPYEALQTEALPQESGESNGAITEHMIASIKQTSSWIRFLSILGFVYAGVTIVPMVLFASFLPFIDSFADGAFAEELGMSVALLSGIIFMFVLIFGALLIVLLIFLHNVGSKMRTYVQTNNASALEIAFKNNISFWKLCGIITIISFALVPVSIIVIGILYV